jgi:EAL domain-containing protein (putative c-di-GMP-specific phosphodiesterase class I)
VTYFACYQPIVDLVGNAVVGHAAFLHERLGDRVLAPREIFAAPGAELAALDRIGRETALRGATGWLGPAYLFVRLLPAMVHRPAEALDGLDAVAAESRVPLRQVVVEVLLGADRDAMSHLARVVTRVRGSGCLVAVTGDPRTAGALAPDFVKVSDVTPVDAREAHAAGAKVIAFGIETTAQANRAAEAGADWGQGWFYGRPSPPPATL